MLDGELRGAAGVSDTGVAAIQELELELGEGSGAEAWRSGAPVLTSDLAAGADTRWTGVCPGRTPGARPGCVRIPGRFRSDPVGSAGALPGLRKAMWRLSRVPRSGFAPIVARDLVNRAGEW